LHKAYYKKNWWQFAADRTKNKKKILAQQKVYRELNREKIAKRMKLYVSNHTLKLEEKEREKRDKMGQRVREYYKTESESGDADKEEPEN